MKATETNLLSFLQGTRQFIIPIYQRTYSWTQPECQQLWNDIVRASADEAISAHFIGSVVYVERGLYQISAVPQVLVIDGQQRLTTLTLLLAALGKVIEERGITGEVTRKKVNAYYLFNTQEEGELHYKLLLTRSDKETLTRILDDAEPLPDASKRITDNYNFFLQQLRRPDVDPMGIYHGVSKLVLVDISLDRTHDNPQLIFESLNSTGRELSQADLIRNYVLMGQEVAEQTQLYNHYWYPMERRLMDQRRAAMSPSRCSIASCATISPSSPHRARFRTSKMCMPPSRPTARNMRRSRSPTSWQTSTGMRATLSSSSTPRMPTRKRCHACRHQRAQG